MKWPFRKSQVVVEEDIAAELATPTLPPTVGEVLATAFKDPKRREIVAKLKKGDTALIKQTFEVTISAEAARVVLAQVLLEDDTP